MATWITKVDQRDDASAQAIANEPHTIGEDFANFVLLNEVPRQDAASTVVVSGAATTWTEVTSAPAASGQFRVTYLDRWAGAIEFHASDAGKAITVSYYGRGSALWARDVNKLQGEKVDRDGTIPFTGAVRGKTGSTAAAPAFVFADDLTSGLYRFASGTLGLATGGVQRAILNSGGLSLAVPLLMGGSSVITTGRVLQNVTVGADLLTGTLDDARLSTNVALRGAAGTFAALQKFSGGTASVSVLEATVTGAAVSRLAVLADGTLLWSGGDAAADTSLYRSAASTLKTDNTFVAGGGLTVLGTLTLPNNSVADAALSANIPRLNSANDFVGRIATRLSSLSTAFAVYGIGDAFPRWVVSGGGTMSWGNNGSTDTNLYRGAAGLLQTDHAFKVGQGLTVAATAANKVAVDYSGYFLRLVGDATDAALTYNVAANGTRDLSTRAALKLSFLASGAIRFEGLTPAAATAGQAYSVPLELRADNTVVVGGAATFQSSSDFQGPLTVFGGTTPAVITVGAGTAVLNIRDSATQTKGLSVNLSTGQVTATHALTAASVSAASLAATPANGTATALSVKKGADAQASLAITGAGVMSWGTGAVAADVTLSRVGAARLGVGGSLDVGDNLAVGGAATASRGIDLGNPAAVGTQPFIDFRYGTGSAADYNARLANTGDGVLSIAWGTANSTGTLLSYGTVQAVGVGAIRPTISAFTPADTPADLLFGIGGSTRWNFSARASADGYDLAVYKNAQSPSVMTWKYATSVVDFLNLPTVQGNPVMLASGGTFTGDVTSGATLTANGSIVLSGGQNKWAIQHTHDNTSLYIAPWNSSLASGAGAWDVDKAVRVDTDGTMKLAKVPMVNGVPLMLANSASFSGATLSGNLSFSPTGTYDITGMRHAVVSGAFSGANWSVGHGRPANYGDLLLGYNLRSAFDGTDAAKFLLTHSAAGAAYINLAYGGGITFGTFSEATVAQGTADTAAMLRWQLTAAGHWQPAASGAYDIGGSITQIRTVWAQTVTVSQRVTLASTSTFAQGSVYRDSAMGSVLAGIAGTSADAAVMDRLGVARLQVNQGGVVVTGVINATASASTASALPGETHALSAPHRTVSLFLGSATDTTSLTAEQPSTILRFAGLGAKWGDVAYHPTAANYAMASQFRFTRTPVAYTEMPNASVGVGRLNVVAPDVSPDTTVVFGMHAWALDTSERVRLLGSGKFQWGDGQGVIDTDLSRVQASRLGTSLDFGVGRDLFVNGRIFGAAGRVVPTIIVATTDASGTYPDGTLWIKV